MKIPAPVPLSTTDRVFDLSPTFRLMITNTTGAVVLRHARRSEASSDDADWSLDARAVVIPHAVAQEVALLLELAIR